MHRGLLSTVALAAAAVSLVSHGHAQDAAPPNWRQAAQKHGLSEADTDRLGRMKVLLVNEAFPQVFTPYLESDLPVFITADSLLNGYFVLFEESLSRLERENARRVGAFLQGAWACLDGVEKTVKGEPDLVQAAMNRARLTLAVPLTLMGTPPEGLPESLTSTVQAEVRRVEDAREMAWPPWLGPPTPEALAIDYGRFRPRGLYTRTEAMERYFRAVSWLQAIPFRLDRDGELLAILMLGCTLSRYPTSTNTSFLEDTAEVKSLFEVFRDLVGPGDAPDVFAAGEFVGTNMELDIEAGDLDKTRGHIRKQFANQERCPSINDKWRVPPKAPTNMADLEFRFFSAAWTPESALFQKTTDLRRFGPDHPFPTGLEVCALLGSPQAREAVVANQGDPERRAALTTILDAAPRPRADGCLHEKLLYALSALLDSPEPEAPEFFRGEAWQAKAENAVLAGWAQERHAWSLQAKETVSYFGGTSAPPGFVEPDPEFFRRMASVIEAAEGALSRGGALENHPEFVVEDIRSAVRILDRHDFAGRGKAAWRDVTLDEWRLLRSAIRTTESLSEDRWTREEGDRAAFTKLIGQMRLAADSLEKRSVEERPNRRPDARRDDSLASLWRRLHDICRRLESLAHKQLRARPFDDDESTYLRAYGKSIAGVMLYAGNSYLTPNDDASRVATVHSAPGKGCLHAATGRPRALYVLYPWRGEEFLCRGAVLPYFEFTDPARLTDDEWRMRELKEPIPSTPAWLAPVLGEGGLGTPTFKER